MHVVTCLILQMVSCQDLEAGYAWQVAVQMCGSCQWRIKGAWSCCDSSGSIQRSHEQIAGAG